MRSLIGQESVYGKEIGGDIEEGKRTLILIHLFNACTQAQSQDLTQIMGKSREDKTKDDIQHVLGLMKRYGSVDYAQQRAKRGLQKQFACLNSPAALTAKRSSTTLSVLLLNVSIGHFLS